MFFQTKPNSAPPLSTNNANRPWREVPGGDLLQQGAHAIVNTVNCRGVMGKGLALTIKQKWPAGFADYRQACRAGRLRPGRLHLWRNPSPVNPRLIINFPTKDDWRQPSRLEYIDAGLEALAQLLHQQEIPSIAIPPLGCGLGGLDWQQVKPRIEAKLQPLAAAGITQVLLCSPAGR